MADARARRRAKILARGADRLAQIQGRELEGATPDLPPPLAAEQDHAGAHADASDGTNADAAKQDTAEHVDDDDDVPLPPAIAELLAKQPSSGGDSGMSSVAILKKQGAMKNTYNRVQAFALPFFFLAAVLFCMEATLSHFLQVVMPSGIATAVAVFDWPVLQDALLSVLLARFIRAKLLFELLIIITAVVQHGTEGLFFTLGMDASGNGIGNAGKKDGREEEEEDAWALPAFVVAGDRVVRVYAVLVHAMRDLALFAVPYVITMEAVHVNVA